MIREGEYGTKVAAVEPGGAEFIPLHERHGKPLQLFWTWTSPNLEFATVFVGVIGVAFFGLSFWQALLAIVIGTGLGSVTQGLLGAEGPSHGVPQMVMSRLGFGYWGNVLPAGLNAITAGIGWFAVNSVSGTFALNTLTHLPKWLCLVIIVVAQIVIAFFGHNLVHAFERYAFPLLAVIFLIATIVDLHQVQPRRAVARRRDRRLPAHPGRGVRLRGRLEPVRVGLHPLLQAGHQQGGHRLWSGLGVFVSCVLLESGRGRVGHDHRHRRRSTATRPARSPGTCPPRWPTSPCWPSRSARSPPTC